MSSKNISGKKSFLDKQKPRKSIASNLGYRTNEDTNKTDQQQWTEDSLGRRENIP